MEVRHRLAVAAAIGLVVGLLVPLGDTGDALTRTLTVYVVGGLAFVLPMARKIMTDDAGRTRAELEGGDGDRRISDVVVIVLGLVSLLGVALLLVGTQSTGGARLVAPAVGLLTVAVGWCCVHTIYTLRYARIYYASDEPPIDFNDDEPPALSDFAYFAVNLGMTYQVSDTDVRTRDLRKVVLGHTLLSYVYGTVVIATTVNLVVGLAG